MSAAAAPNPDGLRRVTIACVGVAGAVSLALVLTFWVLLSPAPSDSCNTSLIPSTFATALGPVHIAAALALSLCLWCQTSACLGRDWPGVPTLVVLGAVWLYIGVSWAEPELFGYAGFVGAFAGPTLGLGGLGVLAIHAVVVWRSEARREERWRTLSRATLALLWGGLLIGLPASMSYAWMSGANPFCF